MDLLEIENLNMFFGGLKAIQNLNMTLEKGEIRGVIGPNGAGKSTFFKTISGAYRPTNGKILYKGKNITYLKPHTTAQLGISRTFQEVTIFKNFDVMKCIMTGGYLNANYSFWGSLFNTKKTQKSELVSRNKANEILKFMGLEDYKDELAVNLPNGIQRALGISQALASEPDLLLLDEPATGMNTEETKHIMGLISKVREKGITIILIEHDMKVVMELCDKISVLNFGTKIAEGSPTEIQNNKDVLEAYLGSE